MPVSYTARAVPAETVRDPRKNDRLGQGAINHSSNPTERATQSPSKFRFARAIAHARSIRIEDEIARRGIKLRGSVERVGPCPVCGGSDRFAINTRKQIWNCRGCQRGGDIISFVQLVDGCSFAEAVATLVGETPRPQIVANKPVPKTGDDDVERTIESVLSMRLARDFGNSPIWALLSAGQVAAFPVLPGIGCMWIAVDNDPAGTKAARECAARWRKSGREVFRVTPRVAAADLNDLARGAAC